MIEGHLTAFDYTVLGIMALSCVFAFFRGLVREILSLAAWIGAGLVTIHYFPFAAEKLTPHFKNPAVAAGVGGVGLYVAALVAFSLLNIVIIKSIKSGGDPGVLDNMLGLMFGALRGALIISLGFFLLTFAMPEKEYPDWLQDAQTRPYVEKGAIMLAKAAPNYLRKISSLQKKTIDDMQSDDNDDAADASTAKDGRGAYNRAAPRQLDRLIDNANQ